jgi:uncharacterized SAM-binding protein YcdF (DUF218 family)
MASRTQLGWTQAGAGAAAGSLAGLVALDLGFAPILSLHGDWTFMAPVVAAAFALTWMSPLRRVAAVATAQVALLWLAVAFTPVTTWLARDLVRSDERTSGDAIFVFGSGLQRDGDPTPDSMARLLRGIELLAEGRAPRLVVSEIPPPAGRVAPLARAWRERFAGRGEVLAIGLIRNTHDEAVAVARLFRERGWSRVVAVTSPTHTRRAAAALEHEGLAVVSVPALEIRFDLDRLDRPGDRREAFGAIAHERLGLLVYRWRGWI